MAGCEAHGSPACDPFCASCFLDPLRAVVGAHLGPLLGVRVAMRRGACRRPPAGPALAQNGNSKVESATPSWAPDVVLILRS